MNQGWIYRDQVQPKHAGLSVLEFYSQNYRHSSREEWQVRLAAGQIWLDGQPVSPGDRQPNAETRLKAGQQLAYHRPPWQEPDVPLNFEVLYDDPDLLVVAKPAGLPVMPGGGFLEHTLLRQLQQRYPQDTPVPIHRLGRGTSGLLVLARSPLARSHLTRQMREATLGMTPEALSARQQDFLKGQGSDRPFQKTYRALIGPSTLPDRFTVTTPIGKLPHPLLGHLYAATPQGKPAYSECQVLHRTAGRTLVEVTILTGRSHQIRIHLAAAGYPLLGDPLYGPGGVPLPIANPQDIAVPGDCGYHLHAQKLSFIHPRTAQPICLVCMPAHRDMMGV